MTSFSHLLSPLAVGPLWLANRLVLPAMGTNRSDDGRVTEAHIAYYERRARAGVGLIIVEPSYIEQRGRHRLHQLGIDDDSCIAPLHRLTQACHACGSKIALQLFHAGGLISPEVVGTQPPPCSPSDYYNPEVAAYSEAMTRAEIEALPGLFATAALRARAAGFDAVEIHGAHGYLLAEFLSPHANRRTDEYGGGLDGRMRLPLEVVSAVRGAVGPGYPILYRFSADEFLEDGLRLDETVRFARALVAAGVDILDVSAGNSETMEGKQRVVPSRNIPPGALVPFAQAIRQAVLVPVIAVGRINTPELAERILSTGAADLVAVARGLLSDPDWLPKLRAGRSEDIVVCCVTMGCLRLLVQGKPVVCTYERGLGHLPPERQAEIKRKHRNQALTAVDGFLPVADTPRA